MYELSYSLSYDLNISAIAALNNPWRLIYHQTKKLKSNQLPKKTIYTKKSREFIVFYSFDLKCYIYIISPD